VERTGMNVVSSRMIATCAFQLPDKL
jgi:hypothetical protein